MSNECTFIAVIGRVQANKRFRLVQTDERFRLVQHIARLNEQLGDGRLEKFPLLPFKLLPTGRLAPARLPRKETSLVVCGWLLVTADAAGCFVACVVWQSVVVVVVEQAETRYVAGDLLREVCSANSLVVLRFLRNVDTRCFLLPKNLLELVSDAFVFRDELPQRHF